MNRRMVALLQMLLGAWLFISPWVFGTSSHVNAWNFWVVGLVITVFAALHRAGDDRYRVLVWFHLLLGAWVFASPWMFHYTLDTGRFVNSLCVGILVALFAIGSMGTPHRATTAH